LGLITSGARISSGKGQGSGWDWFCFQFDDGRRKMIALWALRHQVDRSIRIQRGRVLDGNGHATHLRREGFLWEA